MTVDELQLLRAEMDQLTAELAALLHRRAALARRIAACKKARALPLADPAREQALLAELPPGPADGFAPDAIARILGAVFAESRRL